MSAKTKAKAPAAHPTYKDMAVAAITALANKKGSSKVAIASYISATYKVGDRNDALLKQALRKMIASGAVVKKTGVGCSGSFKLPKAPVQKKAAPKKKAAPAKKVKKPTTPKKKAAKKAAKKSTPKKKVAPKKKAAPKKKVAAKKKPAAKKKTPKKAAK